MCLAFKASEYLESLLQRGAIIPEASSKLDQFYHVTDQDKVESRPSEMLLSRAAVPRIQQTFELPKSFSSDLNRALVQASVRLENHENGTGAR
jgi:hypothetical protein